MISLITASDPKLLRINASFLIAIINTMTLILEPSSGVELVKQMNSPVIEMVLLVNLSPKDGVEMAKLLQACHPKLKILVLSPIDSIDLVKKIANSGIYAVLNNEKADWENGNPLKISEKPSGKISERRIISEREIAIIKLAAKGLSGKEIAKFLNISSRTVEVHKKNLMAKTNSPNFIGVLLHVLQNKLVQLSDFNIFT